MIKIAVLKKDFELRYVVFHTIIHSLAPVNDVNVACHGRVYVFLLNNFLIIILLFVDIIHFTDVSLMNLVYFWNMSKMYKIEKKTDKLKNALTGPAHL